MYVVLLALFSWRMPFKFISGSPPQRAWQWKGGVCPVNAEGCRGMRIEARRGLVTATKQGGIAEDVEVEALKRGA